MFAIDPSTGFGNQICIDAALLTEGKGDSSAWPHRPPLQYRCNTVLMGLLNLVNTDSEPVSFRSLIGIVQNSWVRGELCNLLISSGDSRTPLRKISGRLFRRTKILMSGRSEARRFVLQMLYLIDQNPEADKDRIHVELRKQFTDPLLRDFAWSLFIGVITHRDELDDVLRKTAVNWRVERMPPTDRNVLRMGLFEMTRIGTPAAVVIDESIEIAREFGTENSSSFVNGILDRLIPKDPAAQPGD